MKTKKKIITEKDIPIAEIVLRCNDKKVWISIESFSEDDYVNRYIKQVLTIKSINEVCKGICEKIDGIYKLDTNKDTLINVITAINKIERKLTLITLYYVELVLFDNKKAEFIHEKNVGFTPNSTELLYIQQNNEYIKFMNSLKENQDVIFRLISNIYYAIEDGEKIKKKQIL